MVIDIKTQATAFTRREEGPYTDDARDSGNWSTGITGHGRLIGSNMGVGAPALIAWLGPKVAVTAVTMRQLSITTYLAIATAKYWRPLSCDSLPEPVALMVFDFGWNCGISTSARILQEALGFMGDALDGDIGPGTLHVMAGVNAIDGFVTKLGNLQEAHYRGLYNFDIYGKGWIARTERRKLAAQALVPNNGQQSLTV